MGRKHTPQPLPLAVPAALPTAPDGDQRPPGGETAQISPPLADSKSPRSPRSPFRFANKKQHSPGANQSLHAPDNQPPQQQPRDNSTPQYQPISSAIHQPLDAPFRPQAHSRPAEEERPPKATGFFKFNKGPKNSGQPYGHHYTDSRAETMSRGSDHPAMSHKSPKHSDAVYSENSIQQPVQSLPSKSDVSLASTVDHETGSSANSSRKTKPKSFALLNRSRSTRDKDKETPSPVESFPAKLAEPERMHNAATGLRTAPFPQDRSFRDMMSSAVRNHSEDRAATRDSGKEKHLQREQPRHQPGPYREGGGGSGGSGGTGFFSGLKQSRAADMISNRIFGKGARSGSTSEREPVIDDEHYVIKVINKPLVEQTRLTRISKRLEDSRDKTEFWMPAFPWRAIDYLNYKGTDVEGLYRVPGSGPQIKKWQRKFDEEYDVDLFAQDDLYDINIIGSMLKAWLRELPDELFPKEAQERIARECPDADTAPPLLVDELSNLSPFNYYLLFAITCHLSLLLAHSDKNKMDFRNLCICFQPCMKIDAFCFKFLVCDWRNCWKGCKNEAMFIEEEYMLFDQPPPQGLREHDTSRNTSRSRGPEEGHEDRHASSSDSHGTDHQKGRMKKKAVPPSETDGSAASGNAASTTMTINSGRETPRRGSPDIRPLSPIKPLSPLGF